MPEVAMADEKRTQQATLGCGTFILIALIVAIFSHPGVSNLEREVHGLRSEVGELRKSIDAQSTEIRALRERIEKGKGQE
jgi:hypothetical protein